MIRILAFLVGIVFIAGGVLGYVPAYMQNGLLFSLFQVDNTQNVAHLISGVLAIIASTSYRVTKIYFFLFGIIYTVAAIMGFWRNGDLTVTQVNMADNILYIIIGVIFLYFGLSRRKKTK